MCSLGSYPLRVRQSEMLISVAFWRSWKVMRLSADEAVFSKWNHFCLFSFRFHSVPSCLSRPCPVLSPSLSLSLNVYHPFTSSSFFFTVKVYFHLTCAFEAHSSSALSFNTPCIASQHRLIHDFCALVLQRSDEELLEGAR